MQEFDKELCDLLRARFPFIQITTYEEERLINELSRIVTTPELIHTVRNIFIWKSSEGFKNDKGIIQENTFEKLRALNFIKEFDQPGLFIILDFHIFCERANGGTDFNIIRSLKDLMPHLKQSRDPKNIIFVSPSFTIPDDLKKDVTVMDFKLPTEAEIESVLEEIIKANKKGNLEINLNEKDKESIIKAAVGLTLQEAENAFARAMVNDGKLDADDIDLVLKEKSQVIKKNELLEYVDSDVDINDVGGLENLKKWLIKRDKSWLDSAKDYGLPSPKGVLLTGVPGCGKSLIAKSISSMWHLPLLRFDVSKVFNMYVGNSESNMREAIKTAEAISPCILWIDEIEKGFSGLSNGGDGGTSSRIFGTFLSWMQEKTKPVFVVATANNISGLPSEMMRKGRFDEIFFIDLPTYNERKQIFKVHLQSRLKKPKVIGDFNIDETSLNHLANLTEGFGGAEIEQIIIMGLFDAFAENRSITMNDFENAIKNTVPLSITQAEQIRNIREWADIRAVAATAQEDRLNYKNQFDITSDDSSEPPEDSSDINDSRGGRTLDF
ncbi:AAA family ATPase [Methanosphaera sp. ISO3-F5]|uniref:AAA family ATPase n=1 Tax=Methanosphaera sp. ISO3-F5 TaxID=1452353 RepID=UPI002B2621DD|nr:AAA family ATPase [Methanosphaera sp. ISO3-F5]WQH63676.1 AAA family ATPase [Methanosphaera sp. ISO3-F5]